MIKILICSKAYGGCGFVAAESEFDSDDDGDHTFCPEQNCREDMTIFPLTPQNFGQLTDEDNAKTARRLLLVADLVDAIAENASGN